MNLKSALLETICRTGLCRLSVAAGPKAPSVTAFQVRILGSVRRSSSSLFWRRKNAPLSGPGPSQRTQSIGGVGWSSGKYSLADLSCSVNYSGIFGQFVRNSTSEASRTADVSEGEKSKANVSKTQVSFDELRTLIADGKVTLVDVREPEELQEKGCLPGSVNIPLTKLKVALALNDEEFKLTYNRQKLQKDDPNVVFYGLSSVKSSAAVEIAHKMGFKKSRHYPGGLEEWSQKNPKT